MGGRGKQSSEGACLNTAESDERASGQVEQALRVLWSVIDLILRLGHTSHP